MIGFGSLAEKTAAALEKAKRDLEHIKSEVAQHALGRPDGSDLDQLVDWKRKGRDLADQMESAEEVLENAKTSAAQQAEKAAEAEADRRHAQAQRLARAGEKLVLEAIAKIEAAAEALTAVEANRVQIEAANAVRGTRPFIVDGEVKLRGTPRAKSRPSPGGRRPGSTLTEIDLPSLSSATADWSRPICRAISRSVKSRSSKALPGLNWPACPNGWPTRSALSTFMAAESGRNPEMKKPPGWRPAG